MKSPPKTFTRLQAGMLAALLLADGAIVRGDELGAILDDPPVPATTVKQRLRYTRRILGAGVVETVWWSLGIGKGTAGGYRMVGLPPDAYLDLVLACVPAVKRSAWWRRRTERAWERAS